MIGEVETYERELLPPAALLTYRTSGSWDKCSICGGIGEVHEREVDAEGLILLDHVGLCGDCIGTGLIWTIKPILH
jgi:hypothetical protein